jgi:hypothetical protein
MHLRGKLLGIEILPRSLHYAPQTARHSGRDDKKKANRGHKLKLERPKAGIKNQRYMEDEIPPFTIKGAAPRHGR